MLFTFAQNGITYYVNKLEQTLILCLFDKLVCGPGQ